MRPVISPRHASKPLPPALRGRPWGAPMWMAVVARWYARCTPAWMGNRKQTRTSFANTSAASATWKLYPANADGATDLRGARAALGAPPPCRLGGLGARRRPTGAGLSRDTQRSCLRSVSG